jgi:hypothetical protein
VIIDYKSLSVYYTKIYVSTLGSMAFLSQLAPRITWVDTEE